MGSAVEARDALLGLDGVVRAHPFRGKALVMLAGGKLLRDDQVKAALRKARSKLELTRLARTSMPGEAR